jgi:hypothetical protein
LISIRSIVYGLESALFRGTNAISAKSGAKPTYRAELLNKSSITKVAPFYATYAFSE